MRCRAVNLETCSEPESLSRPPTQSGDTAAGCPGSLLKPTEQPRFLKRARWRETERQDRRDHLCRSHQGLQAPPPPHSGRGMNTGPRLLSRVQPVGGPPGKWTQNGDGFGVGPLRGSCEGECVESMGYTGCHLCLTLWDHAQPERASSALCP